MNFLKYQSNGVIRVVNLFGAICAFFFLDQIFNLEIFQSNQSIDFKNNKGAFFNGRGSPFKQL